QTLGVSIVGTPAGGNYESLITVGSVTNTIADDADTTVISINGTASVTEGDVASYTVSLNNPAATDVTVNLTYSGTAVDGSDFSGITVVTIPAGSGSVNFN